MSVSDVMQSSVSVTGVQAGFPQKELNIKLQSTMPTEHIMAIFLHFRV